MPQSSISLKPFCRNRFSSQVEPSFTLKSFFLHDFCSPDFLQSSIFPHYDNDSKHKIIYKSSALLDTISQASKAFQTIRDHIDALEFKFIQQLTKLLTDTDKTEELQTLRTAMKKCHQRILKSDLDPRLVEDFAGLLRTYDQAKKKTRTCPTEEKKLQVSKTLDQITKEFSEALQRCDKVASLGSWTVVLEKKEVQKRSDKQYTKKNILTLKSDEVLNDQGPIIRWKNQEYFLFLMQSGKTYLKMIDLERNRISFSINSKELSDEELQSFNLFYAESLNLVIGAYPERIGKSVLNIYQVGSRGLKKVANVHMKALSLENANNSQLKFQVLEPQYIIAIIGNQSLRFSIFSPEGL